MVYTLIKLHKRYCYWYILCNMPRRPMYPLKEYAPDELAGYAFVADVPDPILYPILNALK